LVLVIGAFILFSGIYPLLWIIGLVYLAIVTQTESYFIGKVCYIRKNDDYIKDELLCLIKFLGHAVFILKTVGMILCFKSMNTAGEA